MSEHDEQPHVEHSEADTTGEPPVCFTAGFVPPSSSASPAASAALFQEVINFLHRLFPGHNVPGVPQVAPPTDPKD